MKPTRLQRASIMGPASIQSLQANETTPRKPPVHVEEAYFLPLDLRRAVYRQFHELEKTVVGIQKSMRLNHRQIESALRIGRREELQRARAINALLQRAA